MITFLEHQLLYLAFCCKVHRQDGTGPLGAVRKQADPPSPQREGHNGCWWGTNTGGLVDPRAFTHIQVRRLQSYRRCRSSVPH